MQEVGVAAGRAARWAPALAFTMLAVGSGAAAEHRVGPFQFSGWAEFYASANLGGDRDNALRIFDGPSGFRFNGVGLLFEQPVDPVGVRVDLVLGPLGDAVQGENNVVQQAYVTFPLGPDTTLDVGKFLTFSGAEVIEAHSNWTISRSFLFGFAIPFFHTGVQVNGPLNEQLSYKAMLVNGWDSVDDNNRGRTLGLQLGWAPAPELSVNLGWHGGPEQDDVESQLRHVVDAVVSYQAGPQWTFLLNGDYGTEEGLGNWSGVAGYARRALSRNTAIALRAEHFNDRDGARGINAHVNEVTLTYDYRPDPGYLLRMEMRHDWSNRAVFNGEDRQTTLTAGASVTF